MTLILKALYFGEIGALNAVENSDFIHARKNFMYN
jgi:hypothetical protein